MEDAKAFQVHLENINQTLMELKNGQERQDDKIDKISDTLGQIGAQKERLDLQEAKLNEMRGDINYYMKRTQELAEWKASCPRVAVNESLRTMQGWIIGMAGSILLFVIVFIGAFIAHIFKGQ